MAPLNMSALARDEKPLLCFDTGKSSIQSSCMSSLNEREARMQSAKVKRQAALHPLPWLRGAVISNPTQGQCESTPRTMCRHLPSRILAVADKSGR